MFLCLCSSTGRQDEQRTRPDPPVRGAGGGGAAGQLQILSVKGELGGEGPDPQAPPLPAPSSRRSVTPVLRLSGSVSREDERPLTKSCSEDLIGPDDPEGLC